MWFLERRRRGSRRHRWTTWARRRRVRRRFRRERHRKRRQRRQQGHRHRQRRHRRGRRDAIGGGSGTATGGVIASGGAGGTGAGGAGGGRGGSGGRNAGGGASATGGMPAGGGGAGGNGGEGDRAGSNGTFTVAWQDDFNSLDPAMWQLQSFTYAGNLAMFTPNNAATTGGILTMNLTANPASSVTPYYGVEMRSARTITYGKVSARMRFAKGSGVVSGLVLFYTPFPNCDWNEIDIEHLGKSSTTSQLNAMVYLGPIMRSCASSVTPTQDPSIAQLGFDAESDFHLYDLEWTPQGVKYYADGVLLRVWTNNMSLLKEPMNVLLTIWASSAADWAGPVTSTSAPSSAQVDWIKVYSWAP